MKDCGADEAQIIESDGVSAYDFETDPIRTIKLK
jgi:hypothetical protein